MSVSDLINGSAKKTWLRTGQPGVESVEYQVKGGAKATINAFVDREPIEKRGPGDHESLTDPIIILVSAKDVTSPARGDTVKVARNKGGAAEWINVSRIMGSDEDAHELALGR